jgi:acetolactate synthase-1/2/3 large subunit
LLPADGAQVLDALLDRALAQPLGPVHVDLSAKDAGSPVAAPVTGLGGTADPNPGPAVGEANMAVGEADTVEGDTEAARILLSDSRRPVILAGIQARNTGVSDALGWLAGTLGCPVLTTYKAKGVAPDGDSRTVGHFTGARAETEALARADLIVSVGLDPVELIPAPWYLEAPLLVLSAHPGLVFPVAPAVALQGPLEACVHVLGEAGAPSDWNAAELRALKRRLGDCLRLDGDGHTSESVAAAAAALAPKGARITVDAGAHMFSVMALWRAQAPYDVLKSTGLSTMGFALPAAIASSLAEPERPVLAFTGDGGLMMCLAELSTAARLGCRLTVVVLNDAALALIDVKQQRQQRPTSGVRYPAVDFAAAARGLGCRAWMVGPGEALEPALGEAFAHDGPGLVDVTIDPSGYGAQLAALRG